MMKTCFYLSLSQWCVAKLTSDGSVYFIVKTMLGAKSKRKRRKFERNYVELPFCSKVQKPAIYKKMKWFFIQYSYQYWQYNKNMGPTNIYNFNAIIIWTFELLDRRVGGHSFFGLLSIWAISFGFGHRTCCFYYEIATPTSDNDTKWW